MRNIVVKLLEDIETNEITFFYSAPAATLQAHRNKRICFESLMYFFSQDAFSSLRVKQAVNSPRYAHARPLNALTQLYTRLNTTELTVLKFSQKFNNSEKKPTHIEVLIKIASNMCKIHWVQPPLTTEAIMKNKTNEKRSVTCQ